MIQMPLLDDGPIHRLMIFGYSEREADFLRLVGLQGGYFLRRQYKQFTGASTGGADVALIEKLLCKGHATEVVGCRQAKVYHLGARGFYAALGSGDNRNRRRRPPASIKSRLMGLDYILDHPGVRYLMTEEEKVSYFRESLKVPGSALPVKQFHLPSSHETERFFADRSPIYVREQPSAPARVGFSFIDEDFATGAHFEAFLRQYRALFEHLPVFEVVYVAISPNLFWEAEHAFETSVRTISAIVPTSVDRDRLRRYFELRQQAEAGHWQGLDRARLIQLREDRQRFSSPLLESIYQQWTVVGEDAIRAQFAGQSDSKSLSGTFSACLLRHRYDLFGSRSEVRDD